MRSPDVSDVPADARLPRRGRAGAAAAGPLRAVALPAAGLLLVLVTSMAIAVGTGAASVGPAATLEHLWRAATGGVVAVEDAAAHQIVVAVRLPRVLLAAVVGAGLAICGVAVQALVRNPLADPFVLGISSGAAVGAVAVGIVGGLAGLGIYATSVGAFAAAMLACALVYAAASASGGLAPLRLVLVGVALSFGFQALLAVLVYLSPDAEAASTLLFWTVGGFGAASWGSLPVVAAAVALGGACLHRLARPLDALALGDEAAASLGVGPAALRRVVFVVTALMTGAMVAVSGAIGFVGLVVPHVVRLVVGASHGRVLTLAPLVGAMLMVWADLASRTVVAPRELPLGAVTALVGVPVFVTLVRRRAYAFGGR